MVIVLGEWVYVAGFMIDSSSNIKASGIFLCIASLSMCLKYTYFEESLHSTQ